MQSKVINIIKIILITLAVLLGVFLVFKNYPLSGQIEINAQFGKDLPMISSFGPEPRVKFIHNQQMILDSPVYFDIRSMPWFNKAEVILVYQEDKRTLDAIGLKGGPDWHYEIQNEFNVIEMENGYKEAIFNFDLNKAYDPKNIQRFLISTTGDGQILLKSLKVIVKR